jgi:hypothetical protein
MVGAYLSRLVSPAAAAAAALLVAAVPAPASVSLPLPLNEPHVVARAVAESTGRVVPVGMLTTGDSTTVANPDGSFSLSTSVLPTRMRNAAGAWVEIDPTLRQGPGRSITTTATPNELTLSAGGAGPAVSLADHAGHVMALSLPVRLPAPVLSGASATYPNVYRGVDLVVTAQPSGAFGEVVVAHDAAAAATAAHLRFATSLRGLTLRADGAGSLEAVDTATGQAVMTAPPAAMWDSATTGPADDLATAAASGPGGPGRYAHVAPLPIRVDAGGLTLDAAPPAGATYPLYLDPTWTLPFTSAGRQHYGEVQGASSCQTFTTFDNIAQPGVGYNDFDSCIGPYRTFYTVDTSALASNFQIVSSTLKINEVASAWDSCGQGSETVTVKWTGGIASGLHWTNQPGVDSRGNPITSKSLKSVGNSDGTMCSGGTVPGDFNMISAIRQIAASNLNTLTFGLYGNETAGSHSLERFNNNPSILTQYDIPPGTPGSLAASPTPVDGGGAANQGCGSAAAGFMGISNLGGAHVATLSAKLTSSIAAAQMAGVFTIHDDTLDDTIAVPSSSGFVTSGASVSVPTPTLTDGHQYSWSLHATDQYFPSATSATCKFLVDQTAPRNPTITSTDFPAVGSGAASTKTNGQTGSLTLASSDVDPRGGHGSGMRGFAFSLDSPVPSSGATVTASTGSLTVSVTPAQWGTHTLYAEAIDNAGNASGQSRYGFYVPWNPATKVTPGDVGGDGIPDLVTTTSGGNLVEYAGNADPAGSPLTLSTPAGSPDGQGTSWSRFLITHRGSFTNQGVDDLWTFDGANHGLYLFKNVGASPFQNTGNVVPVTKADVILDAVTISPTSPDNASTACATTSTGSCAGYDDGDWSTLTQVLAVGDLYAGTPVAANDNGAPGLLTVEGGSLWYYQGQTSQFYLGTAIQLGTSGWDGVTLLAPGTVNGRPALWARDNATGAIRQYTITFDASGFPVDLGTPSSGTALTIPGGATLSRALYPSVTSPGDLRGSGFPDLVATTTAGRVVDYPGAAPTSAGLATFGSPTTLGAVSGIDHEWPLIDGSGTTAADTAGGAGAGLSGGASWTTDATRGTVVALNGSGGYVSLPQQLISGGSSLTLSVTFQAASGTMGILASTGHDVPANLNTAAMPVMYIGTDGRLYAQFWNGAITPLISPGVVNDGAWHTAILSAADSIQTLFLDGHLIRSQTGTLKNEDPLVFVGAGVFNTSAWLNAPGGTTAAHASYFTGDLSDVRFWASGQSAAQLGVSLGEVDFASDGTNFPAGSAWYSPRTTMTFANGVITLSDAATGRVVATWGTSGYPNAVLDLQTDGNLVIRDPTAGAIWALQTVNTSRVVGDVMKLLANGNLVVLNPSGGPIWQAASRANPGPLVLGALNLCVDDANGAATAGNKVQVWTCNGSGNQGWLVGGDGTVRFNAHQTFCLEVAGTGTGNGTLVDLGSCGGGANQKWTARTDGSLVNPNSGRCLDDPGTTTTNGTQLQIWDCQNNDADSQTFEIPGQ